MPSIQELIKRMTEEANAYVDIAGRHEDRAKRLMVEAEAERQKAFSIHNAIEVLKVTAAQMGETVEPSPAVEVPAQPEAPFLGQATAPNGVAVLDRAALRRELGVQRIRYPVAAGYRSIASLTRQCLITACVNHPDYLTYLDGGGHDLTDPWKRGRDNVDNAVATLGIDVEPIYAKARDLHNRIFKLGVKGVDYDTKETK